MELMVIFAIVAILTVAVCDAIDRQEKRRNAAIRAEAIARREKSPQDVAWLVRMGFEFHIDSDNGNLVATMRNPNRAACIKIWRLEDVKLETLKLACA